MVEALLLVMVNFLSSSVISTSKNDLQSLSSSTAEAHSSLSAILIRLNAGFVSVIDRFTRGKSTLADYQALVNLSNTSRIEAMDTFEKLSRRLSKPQKKNPSAHGSEAGHRRRTKTGSTAHAKHIRSKSAPELSPTPLGPTTPEGVCIFPKSTFPS